MAIAQASKDQIIDRLFTVFRDHGFEGASISELSRATGLGKSSLYHHFPGGKEQMVEAVLEYVKNLIDKDVVQVAASSEPLETRLRKIVGTFETLYAGGRNVCVLGRLATSQIKP